MKSSTAPKTEMFINIWVCMVALASIFFPGKFLHNLFMFTAWLAFIVLLLATLAFFDGAIKTEPYNPNKINQILTEAAVILLVLGLIVAESPVLAAGIIVAHRFLDKVYRDERRESEYADHS